MLLHRVELREHVLRGEGVAVRVVLRGEGHGPEQGVPVHGLEVV